MRYATVYPSAPRAPRGRSIGRCARCHAAVLSDEEHYGDGSALVHGACGPLEVSGAAPTFAPPRPPAPLARRIRRPTSTTGVAAPLAAGPR